MYDYKKVADLILSWAKEGKTPAEIVKMTAEACMGWPYVWGSYGQICTSSRREAYMNRSSVGEGDKELIRKRCQILSGKKITCDGCKYHPNGGQTRIFDCRGFTRWVLQQVSITLNGAGATSQWKDDKNWSEKGLIKDMPKDKVCCVFKYITKTGKMDHTGLHVGGGRIIHCSVEVKEGKSTDKGWTHYAIPRGLYEGDKPMPGTGLPTLRKGSKGEYVTRLQTQLIMLGYDLGSYGADGAFGSKTVAAVKQYQAEHGLTADGIVGRATWASLEAGQVAPVRYTVTLKRVPESEAKTLLDKYEGSMEKE